MFRCRFRLYPILFRSRAPSGSLNCSSCLSSSSLIMGEGSGTSVDRGADEGTTTGDTEHQHLHQHQDQHSKRPKKLIFAPGDIAPSPAPSPAPNTKASTNTPNLPSTQPTAAASRQSRTQALTDEDASQSAISTPISATEVEILSHPARAHQFVTNPPLTISQLHPSNPLHQFHAWFCDSRLSPSSAPETCTLATASLPSGRVSARVVYLKELDEKGWVVYSNWGSREGKGGQVFGASTDGGDSLGAMPCPGEEEVDDDDGGQLAREVAGGNKWAALTFSWAAVERQVRIEGLIEPLSREESDMYWRTRERGSQIGAWASWQSKVLWSVKSETLVAQQQQQQQQQSHHDARTNIQNDGSTNPPENPSNLDETDIEDGRSLLRQRVKEMEDRFANVQQIPLPPFWGGVRLVPESVEFWQGRRSRLHDRFRYVRVGVQGAPGNVSTTKEGNGLPFQWRLERLSP